MTALWCVVFMAVFTWSAIGPHDYPTWALEVLPAVMGFVALAVTRQSFPLTPLVYVLVLAHCVILMVGGHYTYAEVPLFDWLGEQFGWQRNNYDKLGHFAQGFVPAIVAREIVIRLDVIRGAGWRVFFVVSFVSASARSTSSSNGGSRCSARRPPSPSWARKATSGTRSPTWAGASWARCWRWCCSAAGMTGN